MTAILTYHHIADPPDGVRNEALYVSEQNFAEQIAWLSQAGYQFCLLNDLHRSWQENKPLPKKSVIITFDDGFANNYEAAFPILKKHQAVGEFFVSSDKVGTTGMHDHRYMNTDEIRQLVQAGMSVQSHGHTHAELGNIELDQAKEEVRISRKQIAELTGQPVDWIAYPRGSFTKELIPYLEQLGYKGACSVIRDNRVTPDQIFWLPRVMVMRDTTLGKFKYYFSWLYHWVHRRKNRKRWSEFVK